jgi:hypothetical protein
MLKIAKEMMDSEELGYLLFGMLVVFFTVYYLPLLQTLPLGG